jgi:hypothetical protein
VTVQAPDAARVPALNATDAAPPAGANVGAPQPLVVALGAAATTIAAGEVGNVSANPTPESAVPAFGLVMVKVSVTVRPGPMGPAKDFAIVGALGTVSVPLVAVATTPPFAVVMPPAAIVLVYAPAAEAVTFTVTAQEPFAGMVPPASLIAVSPALSAPPAPSVSVPPQVLVAVVLASVIAPGVVGNVSVNARPVTAVLLPLLKVSVRLVVPAGAMKVAPKAFVAVGAESTVSVAFTPLVSSVATAPEMFDVVLA